MFFIRAARLCGLAGSLYILPCASLHTGWENGVNGAYTAEGQSLCGIKTSNAAGFVSRCIASVCFGLCPWLCSDVAVCINFRLRNRQCVALVFCIDCFSVRSAECNQMPSSYSLYRKVVSGVVIHSQTFSDKFLSAFLENPFKSKFLW